MACLPDSCASTSTREPIDLTGGREPDPSAPLFAQVSCADTHLDDPGFVDATDAHVFENLVIDFALVRALDHNVLTAVDQRPECRRLGRLFRIALISPGVMLALSARATKCAASRAWPTICRAIVSSQSAARNAEGPVQSTNDKTNIAARIRVIGMAQSSCCSRQKTGRA